MAKTRRRWTWRLAMGVLATGLVAALALADSLSSEHGATLREVAHTVRASRDGRVVRFSVTRRIENTDGVPDQAELVIALPHGGVVTGLERRDDAGWVRATLEGSERASAEYGRLTGSGTLGKRGPALLSWVARESVDLKIYPVFVGQPVEVRYDVVAPTCYADGTFVADYPTTVADGVTAAAAIAIAAPAGERAEVIAADAATPPELAAVAEACDAIWNGGGVRLVWRAGPARDLEASFARVEVAPGTALVGLDFEVAPVLEPPPAHARVVFTIDASVTQGEAGIAAQLAMVRGYLRDLPDATAELVLVRRDATRLFGRFVAARDVPGELARVAAARLAPGNGSNLDAGLAMAAAISAGASDPIRILGFTDDLRPARLGLGQARAALARLPRDAVVHLVLTDGSGTPVRDDEHELAPAAEDHGGMLVRAGGFGSDDQAATGMLGLVRPIQIDGFAVNAGDEGGLGIDGAGWSAGGAVVPEGTGFRRMILSSATPPEVALRGKIWGRRWSRRLVADPAASDRLAALVFGDDLASQLDAGEALIAAQRGHAVSPVTSMLAVRAGQRPGRYPYGDEAIDSIWGCSGCSMSSSSRCGIGSARCGFGRAGREPDHVAILRGLLAAEVDRCARVHQAGRFRADLTIETTRDEIVAVATGGEVTGAVADCLTEAAWRLALGREFTASHASYQVSVQHR